MTALKLNGGKPTLSIPVNNGDSAKQLAVENNSLTGALMRQDVAEMCVYSIPDKNTDMFRRRIIVSKTLKKRITNLDLADVADVKDTNMPWIGNITFKGAPRPFRNKFILGTVVDIVRQIDGFLYHLSIHVPGREYPPQPLRLVEVPLIGPYDKEYDVSLRKDLNSDEIERHFSKAKMIPDSLITEYTKLGYVLEGNVFIYPHLKGYECRIQCELFGRIVTPVESLRSITCSSPS